MFKLLAIILTALVAAFVPVNAYNIQLFSDTACSDPIFQATTPFSRTCTQIPTTALAVNYTRDDDNDFVLDLFNGDFPCVNPPFFRDADDQNCVPVNKVNSWAVVPSLQFVQEALQCVAKIPE